MSEEFYIQIAAGISASLLAAVAVFQLLLFLGYPLGRYSWGGKHSGVLPQSYRWMSLLSAILLLGMGFVLLVHANLLATDAFPTKGWVWLIVIFLGLNTLGNAASKSRDEQLLMTPLSGICFLLILAVSIFSN